jgi:branched-subunit amino acid aminotransferase/4-amino-4-deoxychorismate lyase
MSAAEAIRNELAWLDGRFLSRGELSLPVGDAGFVLGATVTEQLRTFRGELFLPDDHGDRLADSLAVVGIDLAWPIADLLAAAADIATHNHRQGVATDDLGLVIFATPGDLAAQHAGRSGPPRVAIHTFPLAFGLWADAFDRGVAVRTVSVTQVPESCWPLKAKVRSRLHYHLADREAHQAEPGSRAVLAHADGRISETSTANIAIVRAGCVTTPPLSDALGDVDADADMDADAVELTDGGFYGVRLELVADVPDADGGPRSGAEPDAWIGIDEEAPQVELAGVDRDEASGTDTLVIRYAARDPLLAADSVRLLYSPNAEGPWATIATVAAAGGAHRWEPGKNVPARVFIRIEATDAAGNQAADVSEEAVSVAPTRFGGRLGGLRVVPAP